MTTSREYYITPKGRTYMEKLQGKRSELEAALNSLRHEELQSRHRPPKEVQALSNWLRNHRIHMAILERLDRKGYVSHEQFYWDREANAQYPLQEGYIHVHNRALDRALRHLLEQRYIKQA